MCRQVLWFHIFRAWRAIALIVLAALCNQAFGADSDNLTEEALQFEVNAQPDGPVLVVLSDEAGALWLAEEDFATLRLIPPPATPRTYQGHQYLPLGAIEGARMQKDDTMQRVLLDVPANAFRPTHVSAPANSATQATHASPGAFLNYQLSGQHF